MRNKRIRFNQKDTDDSDDDAQLVELIQFTRKKGEAGFDAISNHEPIHYDPVQSNLHGIEKTKQYVATLLACMGALAVGSSLAWTSPVLPQISANSSTNQQPEILSLNTEEQSWVSSLLAIGAIVGALPTGCIADQIGRRYTILMMNIPFIMSWLILYFAQSAMLLYVGRFLIGIATGSFCVLVPMYVSEIAEINIRGTLGTFFQLFVTTGILIVSIIGSTVSWRILSAISLIPPILLLISTFILPETPVYLLRKGKHDAAVRSLKWLWGRHCDSRMATQVIQSDLDAASESGSLFDLFRNRAAFKGLLISVGLMFFQQASGINAVIFYTVPIFQASGSDLDSSVCSMIVCGVQVAMTIVSSILIDRTGRKSLLLFSSTIMAICLSVLGIYFYLKNDPENGYIEMLGWLPLSSLVLYMITFSIGYGPIPWLMMGELFLPDFKGIATAITVMTNWLIAFVITKSFGTMIDMWGMDGTFWVFGGCMVVATIYVAVMLVETKGKSAAEIQTWLSGSSTKSIPSDYP